MKKSLLLLWMAGLLTSPLTADVEVYTGQPTNAGQEYLLAGWNFNNVDEAPGSQLAVSHGTGSLATNWEATNVADFAGTTVNSFNEDPAGRDFGLRNGSEMINEGRFLDFALSLVDFEELVVTYATRRSSSGFTDQEWWWSVDGEEFTHFTTVTAPGSHAVRTIDFASMTELNGASQVRLRLVLTGLPASPTAAGNNRFDNFQFRAKATVGTAGPGAGTMLNATSGSVYEGSDVFAPGTLQSVAMTITGPDSPPIESIAISLPEGWTGLAADGVHLSGPGLAEAIISIEGDTLTIENSAVTEFSSGTIALNHLMTPVSAAIEDLGRSEFVIKTALSGEVLAEIGSHPVCRLVIPISMIRPVDVQGIALALNRKVAVSGVATIHSGMFSVMDFTTYLQDETAGVATYYSPIGDIWKTAVAGNRYTAVGAVTQVRGLTRIVLEGNDGFIDLGPDQMPEPKVMTIAQLLADADDLEGSLIRIARVSKAATSDAWPEPGLNATLTITDDGGGKTLPVFLNRFTDVSVYPEPDYPLDLVGIFSQYGNTSAPFNTGYQLLPREYGDIHPPSEQKGGFDQWRNNFFTDVQLEDVSISGPDADGDGDGLINLLEYAFGGGPLEDSSGLLPAVSAVDGYLEIVFWRVKDAADLTYGVEASPDLFSWEEIWSSENVPYTSGESAAEETVRDSVPLSGVDGRFLKLVIRRE